MPKRVIEWWRSLFSDIPDVRDHKGRGRYRWWWHQFWGVNGFDSMKFIDNPWDDLDSNWKWYIYIDKPYPRNLAWKLIADHGSMGFTISQSFHLPPSSSFCLFFCMTRRMVSQSLGTMWWNFPGMELRNMFENTYISIIMYSHVMVVQSSVDVGEVPRLMLISHYFLMFSVQILVEFLHDKFYVQSSSQRTRSTFSWKKYSKLNYIRPRRST
jgi:hypothetical protein